MMWGCYYFLSQILIQESRKRIDKTYLSEIGFLWLNNHRVK